MWPLAVCLLASVAKLSSAAALPPSDGSPIPPTNPRYGTTGWGNDSSSSPPGASDVVISSIPLDGFGGFRTLTLQEAVDNPSLFDPKAILEGFGAGLDAIAAALEGAAGSADAEAEEPAFRQALASAACASPRTRVEWRNYSTEDRRALVDSMACLTRLPSAGPAYAPSTSRYEDFVKTHQKMTPAVHGSGVFLPWHRYFVSTFEQALRSECGLGDRRPLPWWDETLENGAFNRSSLFTADYFGSLPGPTGDSGTCIVDGRFANLTCHIGPDVNDVDHCLSRAVDETKTVQSSAFYVNYCAEQTVYGSFEKCAETGPHAWAHNGIGSVMADVYSSASDPIFFMHHLFVDHQFASWQEVNSTRKSQVDGACADKNSPCTDLGLQTVLDMNGLAENKTVADVLDTQGETTCYRYDYYY